VVEFCTAALNICWQAYGSASRSERKIEVASVTVGFERASGDCEKAAMAGRPRSQVPFEFALWLTGMIRYTVQPRPEVLAAAGLLTTLYRCKLQTHADGNRRHAFVHAGL
jgi:hypothetical protein